MNEQDAIAFIHSTSVLGWKLGLANITRLLSLLGNPQNKFKSVHVAGTNGKGSTCAYIASCLQAAGYRTGLYISPYLEYFNERIQINGRNIPGSQLARIVSRVKLVIDEMVARGENHPTEFEIITAVGFLWFSECGVDVAVLEVGMGGRLDSTNVVIPEVSVITTISYDHMKSLGNTLDCIAFEKAGIIKEGRPVVMYPQEPEAEAVLRRIASQRHSELIDVAQAQITVHDSGLWGSRFDMTHPLTGTIQNIEITLPGEFQPRNAATAICALHILRQRGFVLPTSAIKRGMKQTRWRARLEVVSRDPMILLDVGHNRQGAEALRDAVESFLAGYDILLIFHVFKDKEYEKIIDILAPICTEAIVTQVQEARAASPEMLKTFFEKHGTHTIVTPAIDEALDEAFARLEIWRREGRQAALVIGGSLHGAGDARLALRRRGWLQED